MLAYFIFVETVLYYYAKYFYILCIIYSKKIMFLFFIINSIALTNNFILINFFKLKFKDIFYYKI